MNIETARVISNEPTYENAFVIWLHAPGLSHGTEPGQFVMVHCSIEGLDPLFARAFSYYRLEGDRFAILYARTGKARHGWRTAAQGTPSVATGHLETASAYLMNRAISCSSAAVLA